MQSAPRQIEQRTVGIGQRIFPRTFVPFFLSSLAFAGLIPAASFAWAALAGLILGHTEAAVVVAIGGIVALPLIWLYVIYAGVRRFGRGGLWAAVGAPAALLWWLVIGFIEMCPTSKCPRSLPAIASLQ